MRDIRDTINSFLNLEIPPEDSEKGETKLSTGAIVAAVALLVLVLFFLIVVFLQL